METIIEYFYNATGWLVLSVILIGLEFLVPGVHFMWVGFAALVLSGITFFAPDLAWTWQTLIFVALGVVSVLIGRKYWMEKEVSTEDATLNKRGSQYVGRTCEVEVAFKNGKGKIRVEDTLWTATGPSDFAKGASVKIVGQDGTRFKVEPAK